MFTMFNTNDIEGIKTELTKKTMFHIRSGILSRFPAFNDWALANPELKVLDNYDKLRHLADIYKSFERDNLCEIVDDQLSSCESRLVNHSASDSDDKMTVIKSELTDLQMWSNFHKTVNELKTKYKHLNTIIESMFIPTSSGDVKLEEKVNALVNNWGGIPLIIPVLKRARL